MAKYDVCGIKLGWKLLWAHKVVFAGWVRCWVYGLNYGDRVGRGDWLYEDFTYQEEIQRSRIMLDCPWWRAADVLTKRNQFVIHVPDFMIARRLEIAN